MTNENETPLAIRWLNSRENYDRNARSRKVRDVFFAEVGEDHLKLADLGCGTGSNALHLSEALSSRHAEFHLVEREAFLLEEARRRIKEKNAGRYEEQNEVVYLQKGDYRHAFYFYNELASEFMRRKVELHAVCASAVFDLFTENEFNNLITDLKSRNTPLYGTLNYCGTEYSPSSGMDKKFVNLYESHMSRMQHKGHPMGNRTMTCIMDALSPENGWHLTVSNSDWILEVGDAEFISQNLDFYENAIPELISNQEEMIEFNDWMAEKRIMIAERTLAMRVYHQDFFARCL
jgi:hypothetical protein